MRKQKAIDGVEPRRTRLRRRSPVNLAKLPGQLVQARLLDWLTTRARSLRWSRAALIRHLLQSARDRSALTGAKLDELERITMGGREFILVPVVEAPAVQTDQRNRTLPGVESAT